MKLDLHLSEELITYHVRKSSIQVKTNLNSYLTKKSNFGYTSQATSKVKNNSF